MKSKYLIAKIFLAKYLLFSFVGKNLSLLQEEVELNVSASQEFTLPCQITRQSSVGSQFQVTWFFQKDPKQKQEPIFRVDTNSTLQFRVDDKLRFSRPSPKDFHLTLLNLDTRNSGVYFCEVDEWVPSLTHGWRNVTVERSGNYNISVYTEGRKSLILFPCVNQQPPGANHHDLLLLFFFRRQRRATVPVQYLSRHSRTHHPAPAVCHIPAGAQVVSQQWGGEKAAAIAVDRATPTEL